MADADRQKWLHRAVAMVSEGFCPAGYRARLDDRGLCAECGYSFWLQEEGQVLVVAQPEGGARRG